MPSTSRALLVLVSLWILVVLLVPRAAAGVAQALRPTPTGAQFILQVQKETREGVDGVLPSAAQRSAALREELLRRYGVARVEDLPISFRGASLEAGEAAGAQVYARNYALLDSIYASQRRAMRVGALVSPLIAVQNLSAAFAGTDNLQLRAFDTQAEVERMRVIQALNEDVKTHGAGNPLYKADESLWRQFGGFRFQPLRLADVWRGIWPDALIVLGWLALGLWCLRTAGRRLAREMAS